MIKRLPAVVWKWLRRIVFVTFVIAITVIVVWGFQSRTLPDLEAWHEPLDKELTADDFTDDLNFDDYLKREDALFDELDEEVRIANKAGQPIPDRFVTGSPSDPNILFDRNWNRSSVLSPPEGEIKAGAVLLHGLTDGPYSMKTIGEILSANGCYTLCLRMPGHGTVPGGLVKVKWQDWEASLRMGIRHVRKTIGPDAALYLGGYSTGGSIVLKYAIDAVLDEELTAPQKVFLLGPPIRVHPLAVVTKAHKVLSWIPYFEKFRWLSVQIEFDPFKYNSFPKNGGAQSFKLSRALRRKLNKLKKKGLMKELAPVVTFQSVVDATVLTNAVVNDLYMPMSENGSELVLFDVNRYSVMQQFMRNRGQRILDGLKDATSLPFKFTFVTNVNTETREAAVRIREAGAPHSEDLQPMGLNWPHQVHSLSHVALPFRPNDPIYGYQMSADEADHYFRLGSAAPRGERALLRISVDHFMRLRSNPFFDLVEERIIEHLRDE